MRKKRNRGDRMISEEEILLKMDKALLNLAMVKREYFKKIPIDFVSGFLTGVVSGEWLRGLLYTSLRKVRSEKEIDIVINEFVFLVIHYLYTEVVVGENETKGEREGG